MREIKFRAWEKNLKEIIPVHNLDFEKQMINTESVWRRFDEIELMQYTGFQSDEGTEIYEGDILIAHYMLTELAKPHKAIVEWDKYRFALRNLDETKLNWQIGPFPLNNFDPFGYSLKVIGNMYLNPELLSDKL